MLFDSIRKSFLLWLRWPVSGAVYSVGVVDISGQYTSFPFRQAQPPQLRNAGIRQFRLYPSLHVSGQSENTWNRPHFNPTENLFLRNPRAEAPVLKKEKAITQITINNEIFTKVVIVLGLFATAILDFVQPFIRISFDIDMYTFMLSWMSPLNCVQYRFPT